MFVDCPHHKLWNNHISFPRSPQSREEKGVKPFKIRKHPSKNYYKNYELSTYTGPKIHHYAAAKRKTIHFDEQIPILVKINSTIVSTEVMWHYQHFCNSTEHSRTQAEISLLRNTMSKPCQKWCVHYAHRENRRNHSNKYTQTFVTANTLKMHSPIIGQSVKADKLYTPKNLVKTLTCNVMKFGV